MNTFKSRYHEIDVSSALYTPVYSSIGHICNHLPFITISLKGQDSGSCEQIKHNVQLMKNYLPLELAYHGPLDSQTRLLQIFWLASIKETNTSNQVIYIGKINMRVYQSKKPDVTLLKPLWVQINPNNPRCTSNSCTLSSLIHRVVYTNKIH